MRLIGLRLHIVGALMLLAAFAAGAQPADLAPEKGRFLVAREDLGDPNFFRTVVLMLDYSEKGAMGVIVNRPTTVLMSDLFPKLTELNGRPDKVYLGGPVERDGVVLVVRHSSQPEGFLHIADDLYTGASTDGLAAMLSAGANPSGIRAYAGYAGWGPGQLDREIGEGSWLVIRAAPEQVFDPSPQGLWRKLIQDAQLRFAGLRADALLN